MASTRWKLPQENVIRRTTLFHSSAACAHLGPGTSTHRPLLLNKPLSHPSIRLHAKNQLLHPMYINWPGGRRFLEKRSRWEQNSSSISKSLYRRRLWPEFKHLIARVREYEALVAFYMRIKWSTCSILIEICSKSDLPKLCAANFFCQPTQITFWNLP